jgi:hypothetical protein
MSVVPGGPAGPSLGGTVVIIGLGVWMVPSSPSDALFVILAMMIYGLWISYVVGAVPALFAGLAIGLMDAFRGGASLAFAVGLGAAMGVGWSMMTLAGREAEQIVIHLLIGLACIIATIVCWFATRWRVSR